MHSALEEHMLAEPWCVCGCGCNRSQLCVMCVTLSVCAVVELMLPSNLHHVIEM